MNKINGRQLAEKIINNVTKQVSELSFQPRLDIIFIGENSASEVYVAKKIAAGEQAGIQVVVHREQEMSDNALQNLIRELAEDEKVHGIILQLPAKGVNVEAAFELIPTSKDVDGLNTASLGNLWHNHKALIPATPRAVLAVLKEVAENNVQSIEDYIEGKQIVIINRSVIIGKPLAAILTNLNATVTVAHSYTKNLQDYLKMADIIISGVGKPGLINADMLKQDVVFIDAGFVKVENKIKGDLGDNDISQVASWLSPVPNGIGPLGVACLIENTVIAAQQSSSL